jgi:hypothetical protein
MYSPAMRRCKDPVVRDDRPTAIPRAISYNTDLPWKLTTACNNAIGDPVVMILWHSDFPGKFWAGTHFHWDIIIGLQTK